MSKIIPVICLVVALLTAAIAVIGVILIFVALSVPNIAFVASPVAIVGVTLSTLGVGVTAFFRKDVLCKTSLIINAVSLSLSLISVIIWLAAL